ncbi:nucleotide exchange factor GrpE [Buchnera aphidicola]|uniref:Protein GrpE n=1 Tax=Buchnera aphidicola subsp. Rhopalosiphum maidis TaxID=118109 RepID=A0A3G2I5V9_BUCRM|nr:nucleotide exchange factor GrpE [Buchnera aphidicola]AYN24806.1 nucleotide exchange factor GrpE [Buchnera aphidicola (Rhopalosiphum maidis)]
MKNKKDKNEKTVNDFKKEEKKENLEQIEKNNLITSLEVDLKEYQEQIINLQLKNHEETIKLNNRLNNEIEKFRKFSLEKLIIEFLPIIDNIERALNIIKEKREEFYLEIIKKLNFISSLLDEILTEFNISKINDNNVLFDPEIHQAMSIDYNDKIQDNHVVDIMQSGYILHESRLLRPAMVIVSKSKK